MIPQNLIDLARQIAPRHGLDPALVCAVIEQESGGDQWALRFEPQFYFHYVMPLKLLDMTEATARAFSWGVMQVMGQTAREAGFGFDDSNPKTKTSPVISLAALCDPANGIEVGCTVLANKMAVAKENTPPGSLDPGDIVAHGLQLWNGGGNPQYASQVLARLSNYSQI